MTHKDSILIPGAVRMDKRLNDRQKILFGEIALLAGVGKYCSATNKYFAELHGVNHATISRDISALENCDYIRVKIDQQNGNTRLIMPYISMAVDTFHQPRKNGNNNVNES